MTPETTCVYCRRAIRWEASEYAERWVHEASGIPMCRATVATPVSSPAHTAMPAPESQSAREAP